MQKNPYEGLSGKALETCVQRMARTLAQKPRHKKTREYVATLRGREQKTAAQIERELRVMAAQKEAERGKAIVLAVIKRAERGEVEPFVRRARKQRISPIANKCERRHKIKHCRRASRFQPRLVGDGARVARDMDAMRDLRARLHDAQGGMCGICGQALDPNPTKGSLDHVIPRSRMQREDGNYVLTHGECNGDKSNDIPTGCEMVFLLAVNARLGLHPQVF